MLINRLPPNTGPELIPCQARVFHVKDYFSGTNYVLLTIKVTHAFTALNDQNNGFGGGQDKDRSYSGQN